MGKQPRDKDGLSPKEARAAALRAQGYSMTEAYRHAFNARLGKDGDKTTLRKSASNLFQRIHVDARVKALLDAANVQDIATVGEWMGDLKDGCADAKAEGNMTAYMQGMRLLGQALGTLKENVALTVEQRTDDDSLIKRIAGDDPNLAESLRRRLGNEGFDA